MVTMESVSNDITTKVVARANGGNRTQDLIVYPKGPNYKVHT